MSRIEEIGFRFAEKAFRGKRDGNSGRALVSFVSDTQNRKMLFPELDGERLSDQQAHNLVVEYLERMWPSDSESTVIVSNISMKEQKNGMYLVRPPIEGAVTVGYGTAQGVPGFRCIIKDGYFLVIGVERGFYSEAGPDELVLTAPVYVQVPPAPGEILEKTRPPKPLPADMLDSIANLKSKRLFVAKKVEDWSSYIKCKKDIVNRRQLFCRYDSVEIDKSTRCLRFNVSASAEHWHRFMKSRSFPVSVMSLSASKDSRQWQPVENARGLSLGELLVPKKQIKKMLENNSDEQLSFMLEIYPDDQQWDKCSNRIPKEGFLVSEIFSNLIPLQRQQAGLDKLIKGEYVNPRLPDFLFDATKARVPDAPILGLDQADAEFLREQLGIGVLNDEQQLAIAKLLDAPDLALLQGPPGTGKTIVLAAVAALSATRGERVLISSQSNIAVDKIFDSLVKLPAIRPVRFGRKDAESVFSEENATSHWLTCVRNECDNRLTREQKIAMDREEIDRIWPQFADMVDEVSKLVKKRKTTNKRLQRAEEKSAKLVNELAELKRRYSSFTSAAATLEEVLRRLDNCSTVTDPADWVKLIDTSERADIFEPLNLWLEKEALPAIIESLIEEPKSTNSSQDSGLLQGFRRYIVQSRSRTREQIEPNWSVQWIYANNLLNRLRDLQMNLPRLLESCQEVERVCAAVSIGASEVDEEQWSHITNDLDNALQSSGKIITDALDIDGIATSLKPKKGFIRKLAKAGTFLQEVLDSLPPVVDELQEALTAVGRASAEYLNHHLAETGSQVEKIQSLINSLRQRQDETTRTLTEIDDQIRQLESVWTETCGSLPVAMRARTTEEPLTIGSNGLKVLENARSTYLKDTNEAMEHHKLWGPVQQRWVRQLKKPTEADKKRLTPLYLKRCNIVGVTCSWSGNPQVLSRSEFSKFSVVIIDEVSKATPPELLMSALRGSKLILAGDIHQLPPTFKEGRNIEHSYDDLAETDLEFEQLLRFRDMVTASLFKQLYQQAGDDLKQYFIREYRFPSQIREIVTQFYDIALQCDIDDSDERFAHGLRINTRTGEFLTPENHVLWIDTSYDSKHRRVREQQVGSGKANDTEADCVIRLVKLLNRAADDAGKPPGSVELGVITFYRAQVRLIKQALSTIKSDDKKFLNIRVSTVDDFQGMEQQIVILSMVRSKPGQIGDFAKKYERINVAMSRAQKLLIILAAVDTFRKVEVPIPTANGKTIERTCYANIMDIVKKYGGLRNTRDLLMEKVNKKANF